MLKIKIRTETIIQTKIILTFGWGATSEFSQYLIKLALTLTLTIQ